MTWQLHKYAALIALMVLGSGCVVKTRIVREEKLSFPMQTQTPAQQERDGLSVTVRVYGPDGAEQDPAASRVVTYQVADRAGRVSTGQANIALLPKPYFKVTIRNHTQFALRLDRAVIRLKDEVGNTYSVMTRRDLQDWMEREIEKLVASTAAQGQRLEMPKSELMAAYRRLRVLDRDTELGPEDSVTAYLVFDLPEKTDAAKTRAWALDARVLRLQMYQIPCETDQAGNVTKATKFEYVMKPSVSVTEREEQYRALF